MNSLIIDSLLLIRGVIDGQRLPRPRPKSVRSHRNNIHIGDVTTSTKRNPVHTYTTEGTKSVTLTATNENRSDEASNPVTITALKISWCGFARFNPGGSRDADHAQQVRV
jgi:hypothetical protein